MTDERKPPPELQLREPAAGPAHGASAGQTSHGTSPGQPAPDTSAGQHVADTGAGQPSHGTSPGQPTPDTSAGQPSHGTSPGQPAPDTSAGQPGPDTSAGPPAPDPGLTDAGARQPSHGTSPGQPGPDTSAGQPLLGTSAGQPLLGTSVGQPGQNTGAGQHVADAGAGQHVADAGAGQHVADAGAGQHVADAGAGHHSPDGAAALAAGSSAALEAAGTTAGTAPGTAAGTAPGTAAGTAPGAAGGPATLPDPKAAAFEAARIVGEIVGDIESAPGAAIVAAAAAGAAIEAARVRARAGADGSDAALPHFGETTADELASADPVVTVRMHRDRILRALAEDAAAAAAASHSSAERAGHAPATGPATGPSANEARGGASAPAHGDAGTADDYLDEEVDPVQIAAAAIQRLRKRARTDLAELKVVYHRHDLLVLLLAFVIIVAAGRVHQSLVTPPTTTFSERGLTFEHSTTWLPPEPVAAPAPRIVHDLARQTTQGSDVYHVAFTSTLDPSARIEVLIDKKPTWSNIVTGLELDRRTRWGELYTLDDSSVRSIAGHDWLRTAYRYAHVADKGDVPRVDPAVEYATIDRDQIYVITLFGSRAQLAQIEEVIAPTLRVPTQTGLPLVPQTRRLTQRTYPNAVARAFDSTVMVVAADLVDGRLKPRGGGSGVIVGSDGSILTNYHVIHDKNGRLHDAFVIGRFSQPDHAPQLWCAGRPSRGKLQREQDLALIKCDLDLDGRAWNPTAGDVWPTLPEGRTADVRMGQRLWVLGYPDVGGGGLTLSEGQVEGWTGENGASGHDFIRTDASITHGNSGGPVVDDHGRLVGVASAFRTRTTDTGGIIETSQVGLVRPLSTASCLLSIAVVGWTPREDHNDCDLQPSAVEAPAEGVRISTKIVDAANDAPVRDALLMVLRPGVRATQIDVNRLDDLVLAWGRTNTQGEVMLKQPVPVPGAYTVMVVATGYEPLVGESELRLGENTPPHFDPWGTIWIRSR